jgi:hypothetical protein
MNRPLHVAREHELEPQYGLPEALPSGERILWQGSPRWQALARSAFHADAVALYLIALLALRVVFVVGDGGGWLEVGRSLLWLLPLFGAAFGTLLLAAWLTARTTVYTVTDKRIVMRLGIVLTVAFNLPLSRIEAASLHRLGADSGDIALTLERDTRIAWLQLWPHVRPWKLARPQPMLRAVPEVRAVADTLMAAWVAVNGHPSRAPAATPEAAASGTSASGTAGMAHAQPAA